MPASAEAPAATATTTTPNIAHYITPCLLRGIGFAERVLADIPAEKFASCAVTGANHPAFIVGHLSLYPNRIFTMLGRTDLIVDRPGWAELFQQGSVCVEDAAKYPPKDELVKAFLDGHRKVAEVLPTISDEVLARDNPLEGRMREIFPQIGSAVNFLCTSHLMMHLGQISTWRRAIGLGSAM
jgi:hypothetical protein